MMSSHLPPFAELSARKQILGITSDSRKVRPGFVFVAIKGTSADGHDFIGQARAQGAAFVIGEKHEARGRADFEVPDSRQALAELAAEFYGNPSHSLLVIGITGTSGKTTTTYLIESILKTAGHRVGLVGTVAIRYPGLHESASQTTPDAAELQCHLAQMKALGCTAAVMEVSSHALRQHRVTAIAFDAAVFSNLSPEHQDYHPTMEHYFESKKLLFTDCFEYSRSVGKNPVAVVNADDEYGRKLRLPFKTVPFSAEACRSSLEISLRGIRGKANGVEIHSPMTGLFNISNILAATAACQALGIRNEIISRGIEALPGVPGRLEKVEDPWGRHVLVDYAHKPDALEKVLRALREVRPSHARIITVFGCGGDRDRKKRPIMARLAVELSDRVWITSDNPRTESPTRILDEVAQGASGATNFKIVEDRKTAIADAIREAKPGDVVLIAGKGHEDYQILGKTKIYFDDRIVAGMVLTQERIKTLSIGQLEVKALNAEKPKATLVCIHGGPGMDCSYFLPYLTPLCDEFDLWLYDHAQNGAETMEALMEEAKTILAHALSRTQPVLILGHSFGAALVLETLKRHFPEPRDFAGLILASPVYDQHVWNYSEPSFHKDRNAANARVAAWKNQLPEQLDEDELFKKKMTEFTGLYFTPPFHRAGHFILSQVKYKVSLFRTLIDAYHPRLDLKSYFHALDLPVLGITGTLDRITVFRYVERLFALNPKTTLVTLSEAGHFPFVEDPTGFNRAIREFAKHLTRQVRQGNNEKGAQ